MLAVVMATTIGAVVLAAGVVAERVLVDSTAERLEIGAGLLGQRPRRGPPVTELDASQVARLLGGQQTAVAIIDGTGRTLASADNGAPAAVADVRLASGTYADIIATGSTVRRVVEIDEGRVLIVSAPIRIVGQGAGPGSPPGQGGSPPGRGGGPPFVPPGRQGRGDATPIPDADGPAVAGNAIAQLTVSLAPVDESVGALRGQVAALGLVALLVGLAITVLATRRATRPLERVTSAAGRLAGGDLSARTGLSGADEVGAVGLAFDAMAERLEAAFRAQRAFAADASHELRTPIAILGGYVDVLGRSVAGGGEDHRILQSMRREIDRLSRLAGDLLLLTQIEAGGLTLHPRQVDLADLAREVVEASRMIDPAVPIEAVAEEPLPATVDPDRLAQAIRNLVENAVRHAFPGSAVRVRAFRIGLEAAIEVSNAGAPIPPDDLPRLFERFVRRSPDDTGADRRPSGTGPEAAGHAGLGLPIARAISEASGGSIEATSDATGTRFTIRLPAHLHPRSQPLLSEQRSAPA
jgi:signal transduction histidine kinase